MCVLSLGITADVQCTVQMTVAAQHAQHVDLDDHVMTVTVTGDVHLAMLELCLLMSHDLLHKESGLIRLAAGTAADVQCSNSVSNSCVAWAVAVTRLGKVSDHLPFCAIYI